MSDSVIAAIDIGTNSFHLLIAQVDKKKKINILYKKKKIMRLGSEFGTDKNIISKNEFDQSINILKDFRKKSDKYNAEIFAVATSALREAKNKKEYIQSVKVETGININCVSGKKEAEYIYQGMQSALPLNNKKVLCIDIGGGSTEIILSDKGKIILVTSIKVGAVRMMNKFFPDYNLSEINITKCRNYVGQRITSNRGLKIISKYDLIVGASGTIHASASMIHFHKHKKPLKKPNGFSFTKEEFENIFELVLNKKTPIERLGIKGLEAKRADIIPAGLIILSVIFEFFNIKKIKLSTGALREGICVTAVTSQ